MVMNTFTTDIISNCVPKTTSCLL